MKVYDDQAGEIAQPQLAGDLVRRLDIGAQRRLLDIALARRAAGVDVDRDKRFRRVDDDIATGAELNRRLMHRVQMLFDAELLEQRLLVVFIQLDALGMTGNKELHELFGYSVLLLALDYDFGDVAPVEVADRSFDQARFLVDQRRRGRLQRHLANAAPEADQILVVALDLGLAAACASGPDDDRHALRHLQLGDDLLQPLAVDGSGDLARDAASARSVRHQHAIPAGQREVGGQRRAFVAALLLRDLHQHDLPALDYFLDFVVAGGQACASAFDFFIFVGRDCFSLGVLALSVAFGIALGGRLFRQQAFPIGDRDLIVVGVYLVEGEKAVPIATIVHKRGLQRRLDPSHFGEIDIPL